MHRKGNQRNLNSRPEGGVTCSFNHEAAELKRGPFHGFRSAVWLFLPAPVWKSPTDEWVFGLRALLINMEPPAYT